MSPSGVGGRLLVAYHKGLGDPGLGVGPLEHKPPWDLGVGDRGRHGTQAACSAGHGGPFDSEPGCSVFRQLPWHCARLAHQFPRRVKTCLLPAADTHLQVFGRMGRSTQSP